MLSQTRMAVNYAIFAIIATIANIGTQDLVVRTYGGAFNISISIIFGTGVGLVIKYILDKRYIFQFQTRSVSHDTKVFALYTVMGLITTLVFWAFEFAFDHIFKTKEMRYIGGAIGLAIGYITKYQLDKRYVFRWGSL